MSKAKKNMIIENNDVIKPCTIKMLPQSLWQKASETAVINNPANMPAANQFMRATGQQLSVAHLSVLTTKYWKTNGVKLTVGFLDNTSVALKKRILTHMNAWGKFCNVKFTLSDVNPQVRISFSTPAPDNGYWSYLGTDILHVKPNKPTMNLEAFTMNTPEAEFVRVVRHETGHTLGFPHEHMREEIIKKINKKKAIDLFMATQGWSEEDVIQQVLTPIPRSALLGTQNPDPNSIMCYSLPGSIMIDGKSIPGGVDIDTNDASFAALIYPKK